jgi:hypothetical protein
MNKPTIEQILAPKPEARLRIYAYSIADKAHAGLLKVGQTTRDVKQRVAEQLKTAAIRNYKIELDESAERDDGTNFADHDVRAALARKGFEKIELEWMRSTVKDVKTVLTELRTGQRFTGTHSETFAMRAEQRAAVEKRAAISAAAKARWAKVKGTTTTPKPAKKDRRSSPATRAKLAAAARSRWAKVKAEGRKTL